MSDKKKAPGNRQESKRKGILGKVNDKRTEEKTSAKK